MSTTSRFPLAAIAVAVAAVAVVWKQRQKQKEEQTRKQQPIIKFSEPELRMIQAPMIKDGEQREDVSEVDQWLSHSSHWLPFCIRFDEPLDVERVCDGLQRTLAHIHALGARFDSTTNKSMYQIVLSPHQHGVPVEIVHGTTTVPKDLPDESSPRSAWQAAGLGAPPPGFTGAPGPNDPLLRVRIITISTSDAANITSATPTTVSYLAIGISHGLGDGHSVADILQVWSHLCGTDDITTLPPTLSTPRTLGHRITQPYRPAADRTALETRVSHDLGSSLNPLRFWTFFGHVLPRAMWCISQQRVVEVRIRADRVQALKDTLPLKAPEEWVSRFEVVMAALLVAQRVTASYDRATTRKQQQHKLFVACDLRGRIDRFPNDYFGNAAFDFCEHVTLPPASWTTDHLVQVAKELHRGIRHGLSQPDEITKAKDWFEAARHLGWNNQYDVWPIVLDTFKGTGTFVNSWGHRWLDISMGGKENARAMVAYFGVAQNLLVEVPRCNNAATRGDTTVHVALPRAHADRFVAFCEKQTRNDATFPFSVVA